MWIQTKNIIYFLCLCIIDIFVICYLQCWSDTKHFQQNNILRLCYSYFRVTRNILDHAAGVVHDGGLPGERRGHHHGSGGALLGGGRQHHEGA